VRSFIALLLVLCACAKTVPEHPNVLIVTIDAMRADAIGADTPGINAFLREAVRFRNTRTVAPLTLPAHTSIFTGLLPARHGLHDNATEPLPPREERPFPLLAEQFRDAGYATAAFVARAVLAAPTGISGGFDLFDCPASDGVWAEEGGYVPGEERVRAPLAWIEGARGKPWFVWVHLFDPHSPYRAFEGDALRAPTRESDPPRALYAGEVRRADAAFERLLREIPPDTLVILASDHGESLFEHGEPTHGTLCYGSTLDAVLAVRWPGFERGTEDAGLRSVADVAPTVRRICHLPPVEGDGLDLAGPPHETVVSESLLAWSVQGWGQVFAVTDGRHSLVEAGESQEIFDLARDPGETTPLSFTHPAYEKLDRALTRFRATEWGGKESGGEVYSSVAPYCYLRRDSVGYLPRRDNARLLSARDHQREWATLRNMPCVIALCRVRHDPAPLTQALLALDEMEKISSTALVDHCRASVDAALADVTGVASKYRDAAWAEIAAIKKGYVRNETILPAVAYCLAASDAEAFRALLRLVATRSLSAESRQAIEDAGSKLDIGESLSRLR